MSNAGWWPDPLGRHEMRYHDGERWTEHVSDQGVVSANPITAPSPPAVPPAPAAPAPSAMPAPQPASPFGAPPSGAPTQPFAPPTAAPQPAPTTAPMTSPFGADAPQPSQPFGSEFEPPPPLIQEAGTSRKALWFVVGTIVIGAIVAIAIVLAARADDDDDDEASSTVPVTEAAPTPTEVIPATTAIAPPETSPPTVTEAPVSVVPGTTAPVEPTTPAPPPDGIPDGSAGAVALGTTVRAEGSLVRVNSVNLDAPGDDFFEPDEGNTITAIEVEACAGPDGFASNSFYWSVFLPDGSAADSFLFADDLPALELAPGGCIRGTVTYEMPAGVPVASVVLTNSIFSEIARWRTEGAVAVTDRLVPEILPASVPVGSSAVWGPNHRATVQSVEDAAPPLDDFFGPDPGRQYNRVTVEMCAGDQPLPVSALAWFGVGADHWMGTTVLLGDTLPTIELASGECVAGSVQIGMPEGTGTAYVVYAEPGVGEIARWSTG
jgi:hypothetical protein